MKKCLLFAALACISFLFLTPACFNLKAAAEPLLIQDLTVTPTPYIPYSEYIDNYQSTIVIDKSGKLTITEAITVTTETNSTIRHGIYRDFPTLYDDDWFITEIPFNVLSVTRDGRAENYWTQRQANGVRLYIGDENLLLSPGTYHYVIKYETDKQLGFFSDYDELYFNINGLGWEYPILQLSADVILPAAIPTSQIGTEGYTGPEGSTATDFTTGITTGQNTTTVSYTVTKQLYAKEGLTVAILFPKNIIPASAGQFDLFFFLRSNYLLVLALSGFFWIIGAGFLVWLLKGRDPSPSTIIPLFHPPKGLSAAAARYLDKQMFDNKAMVAGIVDLAVSGNVKISNEKDKYYLINQPGDPGKLAPEEQALYHDFFPAGFSSGTKDPGLDDKQKEALEQVTSALKVDLDDFVSTDKLRLSGSYSPKIRHAKENLEQSLKKTLSGYLVSGTLKYSILVYLPWVLIELAIVILTTMYYEAMGFFLIFSAFWNVFVWGVTIAMIKEMFRTLKDQDRSAGKIFGLGCACLFFLPFACIGVSIAGGAIAQAPTLLYGIILLFTMFVPVALFMPFYWAMLRRTKEGRAVYDKLLGFKMFLVTAERFRIADLAKRLPEIFKSKGKEGVQRLKLFNLYLPYAIALDVEKQWSDQFAQELNDQELQDQGYHTWYTSTSSAMLGSAIGSSLASSLSSSIASSSTVPGSSSGSSGGGGGGGSSGGGGGGGGGGGW